MSDTGEAFWRWLGRGLLAVVVLVAALTASDYGSRWDEKVRADAGERKLEYYAHLFSGDWEKAVEVGRKADNYPGFYDLNLAILRRVSPFSDTLTGHVFSAFFGVLGIAGAMRLGRSLGGAQVGFWTGTLLAFTPSYYGHMFINPKDIPFASTTARHAILSFPTAKRQLLKLGITFRFHSFRERFLGIRLRRRLKKLYPAHHWEIDFAERYSQGAILEILRKRFTKVSVKRLDPIPYQTFFICEKA